MNLLGVRRANDVASPAGVVVMLAIGRSRRPGECRVLRRRRHRRHGRRRAGAARPRWCDEPAGSEPNERVGTRYERIWDRTSGGDKRWARRTSECESGGDPDAIGGGGVYRGAFQFMRSTWKRSPKSPGGDPIAYPYRTQAVVAILLRSGTAPGTGRSAARRPALPRAR